MTAYRDSTAFLSDYTAFHATFPDKSNTETVKLNARNTYKTLMGLSTNVEVPEYDTYDCAGQFKVKATKSFFLSQGEIIEVERQ